MAPRLDPAELWMNEGVEIGVASAIGRGHKPRVVPFCEHDSSRTRIYSSVRLGISKRLLNV